MRILLADDHPVVRHGIGQLLIREFSNIVLDEAGTSQQTLELVKQNEYDLIILDLIFPDCNGLECLEGLKRIRPMMAILVLSMHEEREFASRVIKAGALGFLNKQRAAADIIIAVRRILSGHMYVSETYAEQLAVSILRSQAGPLHECLTKQEFSLMCLIASGKTVSEISRERSRSVKTISTQRVNVLRKMKMKNNAELIHYCVRHGLA